jgi:hypothetical protein
MPFADELLLQLLVVLHDTIVYNDQVAAAVAVGVGIEDSRAAVGGPSGVANAYIPLGPLTVHGLHQGLQLSWSAAHRY